ncbi:hypothetical protein CRG98_044348 [Punica granatum]|uniref:Ribulose bisphosphate carboxylase/oxygenase activase AAA helical domain-containing protein n=1 Tax=Punica granatum TaxID=22663 RepID=A0A2I0HU69_PUNGR|nr:hypothetical protein CRG98_044348 [Punica granatum]
MENPHVPIIVTDDGFSTLYAPLFVMVTKSSSTGPLPLKAVLVSALVSSGSNDVPQKDIVKLVDTFPSQSVGDSLVVKLEGVRRKSSFQIVLSCDLVILEYYADFFGALRARVYDDEVGKWIAGVGVESIRKKLFNSKEGHRTIEQPEMTLEKLLKYGNMLVQEQGNVKRVILANKYLSKAALGDANEDSIK